MKKKGCTDLKEFIEAFKAMMSNRYGGYVILYRGDYFVQMTPTLDCEHQKIDGDAVIIESASHLLNPNIPNLTKEFLELGIELNEDIGNYSFACDVNGITDDEIVEIINDIFSVYGVDVLPYDLELELFKKMPDECDLTHT